MWIVFQRIGKKYRSTSSPNHPVITSIYNVNIFFSILINGIYLNLPWDFENTIHFDSFEGFE